MVSMMNAMVYNGDFTFPTKKNGIFFRPKTRGQLRYITLKELDKEGYRTLWDFRTPGLWLAVRGNVRMSWIFSAFYIWVCLKIVYP